MHFVLYQLGSIVAVQVGLVKHVGIVSDPIVPMIISCSQRHGCVVEETLAEFSGGNPVTVVGYPGSLDPLQVVARARQKLGKRWNLVTGNCEHFVSWAHGRKPTSPQLSAAVGGLAALALVVFFVKARSS